MKIGEKIKELRLIKGMTLAEVETRAGLSDGNLSRIERGKQWLTEEKLHGIAEALGVKVFQLFIDDKAISQPTLGSHQPISSTGIKLSPGEEEWLSLRGYLGSDDIAEFTALIRQRQERNIKLLEEMQRKLSPGRHVVEDVRPAEIQAGAKKQISQSS